MSQEAVNNLNEPIELWRHPNPQSTQLYAFQKHVTDKHKLQVSSYQDLWRWSIQHPAAFWEEIWHYTGIKASKPYTKVGTSDGENLAC